MRTQFVTDNIGNKLAVILPIKEYEKLVDDHDELEDIKAYRKAKSMAGDVLPLKDAIKEMNANRKKKK